MVTLNFRMFYSFYLFLLIILCGSGTVVIQNLLLLYWNVSGTCGNLSMHMSSVCCKELYFRKLQMNMIRDYHMLPTLSKTLFHFTC